LGATRESRRVSFAKKGWEQRESQRRVSLQKRAGSSERVKEEVRKGWEQRESQRVSLQRAESSERVKEVRKG
jgi:hypothetical protein